MSTLVFLVPLALLLGGVAVWAFFWSMRNNQYEDLDGAAERILDDSDRPQPPSPRQPEKD